MGVTHCYGEKNVANRIGHTFPCLYSWSVWNDPYCPKS